MRTKNDDVIFSKILVIGIIAVIDQGKFLHKFKQSAIQYNLFNFIKF